MAGQVDNHIHHDMIEPLLHAAACYAGEHALMWQSWDLKVDRQLRLGIVSIWSCSPLHRAGRSG
jgi:hypothetical protein